MIVENAQALCKGLQKRGIDIVSGGTDNHLMLVDLRSLGVTGKQMENLLDMKVNLRLWVKVRKDWRDSDILLKNYGYNKKEL